MKAYGARDKKFESEKPVANKRSLKKAARQFLKKTLLDDGLSELPLPGWMGNGVVSGNK